MDWRPLACGFARLPRTSNRLCVSTSRRAPLRSEAAWTSSGSRRTPAPPAGPTGEAAPGPAGGRRGGAGPAGGGQRFLLLTSSVSAISIVPRDSGISFVSKSSFQWLRRDHLDCAANARWPRRRLGVVSTAKWLGEAWLRGCSGSFSCDKRRIRVVSGFRLSLVMPT
jgi:hypothetical protein